MVTRPPRSLADGVLSPAVAQRQASDPVVSAWVGASAGTGKTKVLTDRVLRLMLGTQDQPGAAPDRMLCITYTKAAASEMGNRLASRLRQWAVGSDDALSDGIADLTGQRPNRAMMDRARTLFAKVLDLPGGMRILTIHAFCQSVLRRFPVEAGVSPQFTAIEARDQDDLVHQIRQEVLAEPGEEVRSAINALSAELDEAALTDRLKGLLAMRARFQAVLQAHGGANAAIEAAASFLGTSVDQTADDVIAQACEGPSIDEAGLRAAVAALRAGGKQATERAAIIERWLTWSPAERALRWSDYQAAYLTNKGAVRSKLSDKPAQKVLPLVEATLQSEAARVLAVSDQLKAVSVARATAAIITLGSAVLTRYRDVKARRGLLDFDDLILRTAQLLQSPGRAPWVLFKLDGGIDHILVDEAQDTSPAQWVIIDALVAEFFAGQGARSDSNRTLFVVGDEKQSIYSFQGADPAEFGRQRALFDEQTKAAKKPWYQVPLAASFRSGPAVLSFVDAVFADPVSRDGVVLTAETDVSHAVTRRGQAGSVTVWPAVPPPDSQDTNPWVGELGDVTKPVDQLAGHVAATVHRWLTTGVRLESRDRPIHGGDILILLRSRTAMVAALIKAMKSLGVPVAGADRMVLTDQIGVQDLLAALRFALLPSDDLTLAAVLRSPLIDLAEDRLLAVCHARTGTVWQALSAQAEAEEGLRSVRAWLTDLIERAERSPPFELLASLLGRGCPADGHSGRRAMLCRLGPEAEEAIDELLALALDFQRSHPPSIQGFVRWIEAGKAEVKREQESQAGDAVRIMTVHGAKGLQAPIVLLPDAKVPARRSSHPERYFWLDGQAPILLHLPRTEMKPGPMEPVIEAAALREEQEYRRLLYVALTRAEDHLVIGGLIPKKPVSSVTWYDVALAGFDRLDPVASTPFNGPWEGEERTFALPQTASPDRPDRPAPPVPGQSLPDWAQRPPREEPSPTRPLTPSRPTEAEPAMRSPVPQADQARRFKRGILIHTLLQGLPEVPPEDREGAAQRFLSRPALGLRGSEVDALIAEVIAVLNQPDFAALFGPDSQAEVPIVGTVDWAGATRSLSGQIDRLVVTNEEVLIVDFKTNRPPPATVEAVPAAYHQQMAAYRAALTAIYPDKTVRCGLLWTDSLDLMWLPDVKPVTYAR